MNDVDPKVLARLIKQEKKGKLIWQKQDERSGKFELVSNGQWTVIVEEITEPAVRMSLFGVFDRVIEPGEGIEMHYGEIHEGSDFYRTISYRPELFNSAANLTRLQIGSTGLNPAARFIFDNEHLTAIDPDIAELSYGNIVYRSVNLGPRGPMYIGQHKEIIAYPIWPHLEENTWESIIQKFTGSYTRIQIAKDAPAKKGEEEKDYPDVDDETYQAAVAWVIEEQAVSVSAIQRHFRLGYTDSAMIVNRMEQNGIVGPFNGDKPREVLIRRLPE